MKAYVEPIVNLLYLADEDILTVSDPGVDDPGWDNLTNLTL